MPDPRLIGSPDSGRRGDQREDTREDTRGDRREAVPGVPLLPRRPPMPLLRTTVGEVLRRLRLEQGRTLADVASAAKVSMPYLSELERGRKEASSEILAAICTALEHRACPT